MELSPVSMIGDHFGNAVTTKADLADIESLYG